MLPDREFYLGTIVIKSEQKIHSRFLEILASEQNWTCKHKIGHCDLTLLCFFYFHNFEYQGSIYGLVKFIINYI